MRCPYCNHEESKVVDSRPTDENQAIRRRRECINCHKRFTTYEKIEDIPLMVIKKDGTRELFDRNKLITGIMRACQKRAIPNNVLNSIADDVEMYISQSQDKEVKTSDIGERVLEKLIDIDEVAYARFASVYREFRDLESFMSELETMIQKDK